MLIQYLIMGLSFIMALIGIIFLFMYKKTKKTINKENDLEVRNNNLNLYISLLLLIGAFVVLTFTVIVY